MKPAIELGVKNFAAWIESAPGPKTSTIVKEDFVRSQLVEFILQACHSGSSTKETTGTSSQLQQNEQQFGIVGRRSTPSWDQISGLRHDPGSQGCVEDENKEWGTFIGELDEANTGEIHQLPS